MIQDTTYDLATTTNAGLMSASDKSKLNGIAANANSYTFPTASTSTKGGVKIGNGLSVNGDTLNVTLSGGGTNSNSFTEPVTLSGGFISSETSVDLRRASINANNASISGTILGNPTFSKPIYIDNNTNSTIPVGLCCDISDGKPRLKLRMNNMDYIFNCDTSVAAGSG